jgi:hypothetical protein
MSALTKIKEAGFSLTLEGDNLKIIPFSKLTEQQLTFLKLHKLEIVSELKAGKAEQLKHGADAEQAIKVYCYRVKEKPDSELVAIMPGASLAEAQESLSLRFGDNLIEVYENTRHEPEPPPLEGEFIPRESNAWYAIDNWLFHKARLGEATKQEIEICLARMFTAKGRRDSTA